MRGKAAAEVVALGALVLQLGRVDRATFHPDGVTPESDTDHSVMLSVIGCAFAARHPELGLDLGLVAQFATVHDLVEAIVGDTPTLRRLTRAQYEEKRQREHKAFKVIEEAFPRLSWVAETIARYERLDTPEARYVKALDKLMPKITHILNHGVTPRQAGVSREELSDRYAAQLEELRKSVSDFPPLLELREDLVTWTLDTLPIDKP